MAIFAKNHLSYFFLLVLFLSRLLPPFDNCNFRVYSSIPYVGITAERLGTPLHLLSSQTPKNGKAVQG